MEQHYVKKVVSDGGTERYSRDYHGDHFFNSKYRPDNSGYSCISALMIIRRGSG